MLYSEEQPSDAEIRILSEKIEAKYKNSVYTVNAYTKLKGDTDDKQIKNKTRWCRNVGTAFPIDEQGHLITFLCVVKKAEKVVVVSRSGDESHAEIVGTDKTEKIAILKIMKPFLFTPPPISKWNSIHPGNKVILLGVHPENEHLVTQGVISKIHDSDGAVLVSIPGNPGTAGTPVFDSAEKLLGILAFHVKDKFLPEGEISGENNFYVVIPMEYASVIAYSIINNEQTQSGWLGISIPFIEGDNNGDKGVKIQSVAENSPAAQCGLQPHDMIIEYNGFPVSTPKEMITAVASTKSGDTVPIKVIRQDSILQFKATLISRPLSK
ncbi:S1C family serine protease [bacterium]|nr:S1C family serine protease [bacterium]